jgi:hypothetical protein
MMKSIVFMQAKAKRLFDSAHEEIKGFVGVESVPADQVTNTTVNLKIGSEVSEDSPLGAKVNLVLGDLTQRDELAGIGGLEDDQKEIFACLSLKVAEGKDPEDARDAASSLVTKYTSFIASKAYRADKILSKIDFKYRVRDGYVRIYVMVDQTAKPLLKFNEEVWTILEPLFNDKVA